MKFACIYISINLLLQQLTTLNLGISDNQNYQYMYHHSLESLEVINTDRKKHVLDFVSASF